MRLRASIFPVFRRRLKRSLLLGAIALLVLAGCREADPFDPAEIAKDLENETPAEVLKRAGDIPFDPPKDGRLTAKQVAAFIKVTQLTEAIRKVAEKRVGEHADRASVAGSRFERAGEVFAAMGNVRAYASAGARASLNLGLNPGEMLWVEKRIVESLPLVQVIEDRETKISNLREKLEVEEDPVTRVRYHASIDDLIAERDTWEAAQDFATLENAQVVRKHRSELSAAFPQLMQ